MSNEAIRELLEKIDEFVSCCGYKCGHARKYITQALALLRPCKTCGGSGKVPTPHSKGFGKENEILDTCPACQKQPKDLAGKFFEETKEPEYNCLCKICNTVFVGLLPDEDICSLCRAKPEQSQSGELRELLAQLAHKQWSGWIKYMFAKCVGHSGIDGIVIPEWAVERWKRQANTDYSKLSDKEKDSDRTEVDKFLAIFTDRIEQLEKEKEDLISGHFCPTPQLAKLATMCNCAHSDRHRAKDWARIEQLEAFALKLVDGDRSELDKLDYWAEEYLHAYDQLAGVREISDENERLKAKIKQFEKTLEEASTDFYHIHKHPEDAHVDAYKFMNKIEAERTKDGTQIHKEN